MKRGLSFAAALVAALLLHLLATTLVAEWSLAVDLLLLVVVFNALDGNTLAGMLGGVVAGWVTDSLVGPAFGLFGLVDTIIGYGAAFSVQRIVIQRPAGAALFFATALLLVQGGENVGQHLGRLGWYLPGYSVSWGGALLGAVYGLILGGVTGWVTAWTYNRVAAAREGTS